MTFTTLSYVFSLDTTDPTISNPLLLTTKGSNPTSLKEKKLIVLNNFTSLKTCTYIMREMKDACCTTDIPFTG